MRKLLMLPVVIAILGILTIEQPVYAQEDFIGEIKMVGFHFAPRGWAFCDGQLLLISQNTALFSLLGTTYGGDGETTFALPDLRGRVPIHPGQGPGLTPRVLGEQGGDEEVTLTESQLPAHTHQAFGSSSLATQPSPEGNLPAAKGRTKLYVEPGSPVGMDSTAIGSTGGNSPHANMQPFLGLNYIIALQGIFPS